MSAMEAKLIIKDANVITMTRPTDTGDAQAVAIGEDRILAVGTNQEMNALIGSGTEVLSLYGKTVLPGFIDTHVHFLLTGLGILGPSVSGMASANDVLAAVADVVARAEPNQPVLVHGYDAGELDRPLDGRDLNRIATQTPVMLSDIGGHACVVNTRAWQILELPADTPGIKMLASGELGGVLVAQANNSARYRYFGEIEDSTKVTAYHKAAELALRYGITTVHALEGGSDDGHGWLPEQDVEVLQQEQTRLPVRTVIYFQSTQVRRALEWNLPCIGGCLYVDGAYGEHTAALLQPYTDDPSTTGSLYFTNEELNDFVERAHKAGLQISMHAIGDAAIEQLLSAYERALQKHPRHDHRHRIEHFSLPTPDQIERVTRLGVAVAMQPNFALMPETGANDDYQFASLRFLGPDRFRRRHPYRQIVDAGILVAGGSDSDAGPLGPLLGIHAVVNHPDEERRLGVYESLSLYTKNGAMIAFEEKDKGAIAPGKLADLVVLGKNPLTVPPGKLQDIAVETTIVGGRLVYERKPAH
jgi:predicted amidohydrolase YtcJ